MVKALIEGQAQAPFPKEKGFERIEEMLKQRTHNSGEIIIQFQRISRFKEQAHCGRISMYAAQPATKSVWPEIGGDLNICDNGYPPLRICPEQPKILVTPDVNCQGGKSPVDTAEVKAAIANSLAHGGLTAEQANQKVKNASQEQSRKK